MREGFQNIKNEAIAQITDAKTHKELEELAIAYLGRKGKISLLIKNIRHVKPEERKSYGSLINSIKQAVSEVIADRKQTIASELAEGNVWFDVSIPGTSQEIGHLHPLTQVLEEVEDIFTYLGYQIADGPEIETDYYNFEALNMPKDHPARDTQMTFQLDTAGTKIQEGEVVLRTQTSAMQGRVMEATKPPFRVLVPGRNFRYEQVDASHGFEFWQVEGFVVDKNITLTNLFGTIEYVLKKLFGSAAKIKFATTNFPFVEPGVDAYLACTICGGSGCSFCKGTGWSEIMPAGMIHPNVLTKAKIDITKWGGFAFAIGLSRIVNLKYHIQDLRTLTTPDMRILRQF